ncbi:MAG: hypothetical protein OEV94_01260 [Deltaproteobacteria bacterium]|nr:hypothetical protein [Deltaproteobacteria bacterium]
MTDPKTWFSPWGWNGPGLPPVLSGLAAELTALREGAAWRAGPWAEVIVARGAGAEAFLDGLVTRPMKGMAVGSLAPALLCDGRGKILTPVEIIRSKAEQFLLVLPPGEIESASAHLDSHHVREEVELGRVDLARLDVMGPQGAAALAAAGVNPAQPLARWQDLPLLVLPNPVGRLARHTLLAPALQSLALALSPGTELSAGPLALPCGEEAWEEIRVWAGWPRWKSDYQPGDLPGEASLEGLVHPQKGCYLGQEVHTRMRRRGHPNRKLVALRLPEGPWHTDTPLLRNGQPAGQLSSLSRFAREGKRAALGWLPWPDAVAALGGEPLAPGPAGTSPQEHVVAAPLATDGGAP